ncbi:MAG: protein kinase [Acidobacteriota bacterium]
MKESGDGILPEREEKTPELIGPYRVLGLLGVGGMGTVYLAERADHPFRQQVAIKRLHAERAGADLIRRFHNERQILAGLRHPHIAHLLDGGVAADGSPYMVMEVVEGEPIDRFCDRNRLAIEARLALFEHVCDAVQYAHQNLVVHRDLKPSNVLVSGTGEVKLLDFGIAKVLNPELANVDSAVTRTDSRLLTPRFASPEQILGEKVTTACDVYTLGVLLFHLLVGRSPYKPVETGAVQRAVLEELPDEPSVALFRDAAPPASEIAALRGLTAGRLRRCLRGDLDSIVRKALRKEPARRYASAEQLREDLTRFRAGAPVQARRDTRSYRLGKWISRHRAMVAILALTVAVAAAALIALSARHRDLSMLRQQLQRSQHAEEARALFIAGFLEPLGESSKDGNVIISDVLKSTELRLAEAAEDARADLLERLAETTYRGGDTGESRRLLEAAVELRQREVDRMRAGGELPADVARASDARLALARSEGYLAKTYYDLGLWRRSEQINEKRLADLRAASDPPAPELAEAMLDLSYAVGILGDRERAESLRRQALDLRLEIFGPESREVAAVRHLLATTLRIRGKLNEAERLIASAVRSRRRAGGDSEQLALSLRVQAEVLFDMGRLDLAEVAIRESLELVGSPRHPDGRYARFQLARIRLGRDDPEDARVELSEVIAVEDELFANGSVRGAMYRTLEARIALALGSVRAAWAAITRAREAQAATVSAQHRSIAWSTHVEGLVALAEGDLTRAEQQLGFAHQAFSEQQEPQGWKRRSSLRALARLAEALGRSHDAAAYRQELREAEAAL